MFLVLMDAYKILKGATEKVAGSEMRKQQGELVFISYDVSLLFIENWRAFCF